MTPDFFLRALRREARASWRRFAFFVSCLAVGVAAVTGVAALASSVGDLFRSRSKELLGADLEVSGRRALPPEIDALLAAVPHERTDVKELPTMARAAAPDGTSRSRLIDLRVLGGRYPLYGALQLDPPGKAHEQLTPETTLVTQELLAELSLKQGDTLFIGGVPFQIVGLVTGDTEGIDFSVFLGPRVFVSAAGLERTSLLSFGSRVRYRALFQFPELKTVDELVRMKERLQKETPDAGYYRFEIHTEGQPGVQQALDRLGRFLGLIALLSLLLGGIGTAQVVRTWIAGKIPAIAVQRCIGFRPREVLLLYLGQVTLLALVGSLAGCALGSLFPVLLPWFASDLVPAGTLQAVQWPAIFRGLGLGLGIALAFGLPALTEVWRVPPLRVLRADVDVLPAGKVLRISVALALLASVYFSAFAQVRNVAQAAGFTAALFGITGLLYLSSRLLLAAVARVPRARLHPYLKQGMAALARPGSGTTGTIVALGLGISVVFTVQLVRLRLEEELTATLPAGAPSAYVWDIQPSQWEGARGILEEEGATNIQGVPVVNCRLKTLNGRSVQELLAEQTGDSRARWLFTREQRITWLPELPSDNEIVAGELWSDPDRPELSVEEDFAKDLGIDVGSTVVFDIQGVPIEFAVTSLRRVSWRSFGINFFLLAEPEVLTEAPHVIMAGVRMSASQEQATQDRLSATYPNATLIRVRPILNKVTGLLDQVILAIAILGSFTVVTGLIILAGAVSASLLRRSRETALLKTLGVTRRGVITLFAVEYSLLGFVAGGIGAVAAFGLAALFLEQVLDLPAELPYWQAPLIALGTAGLAVVSGLAASGRALRVLPLETLRRAE